MYSSYTDEAKVQKYHDNKAYVENVWHSSKNAQLPQIIFEASYKKLY